MKAKPKPRVKAGTSKAAAHQRKILFANAYLANGGNGTQAALTAGCPPKSAHVAASEYLKDPKVKEIILEANEKAQKIAGLSVERTLKELARLAYSDPRKFYDAEGNLIPIVNLGDDAAACIASFEVDEITVGSAVIGQTKKIKHWDKNSALEKAMKYHGLYEKDNEQQKPDAPETDDLDWARRIAFALRLGEKSKSTIAQNKKS
ncbi:MAG: terminase small subunit [Bellilinea sp.]